MQDVAAAAGVGKGTLYRYFPSKEKLFLATLEHGMSSLSDAVDEAASSARTSLERVEKAVVAYLAYFDANPALVELIILERAEFKDRAKPTYFEHRDARLGPWADLFKSLIDDGIVRDVPVRRVTSVISDLLYGTIFTNLFAGRSSSFEEQAGDVLDVFLNGILTPAAQQQRQGAP